MVMLGYDLWQRRFGGDPGVIGSTQVLNGAAFTVVGILPRDFVIPNAEMDVAAPLQLMSDPRRSNRGTNFLRLMARLKPGVTPIQAERELGAITDRLRQQFPEDNGNLTSPKVVPLQDEVVGNYRQSLLILLGAVCRCAPHRLLEPGQSPDRAGRGAAEGNGDSHRAGRERLASSATTPGRRNGPRLRRWHARFDPGDLGKDLLVALSPGDFPLAQTITIDGRVLAFCAGVSLLAGLVLSLAPALRAARSDLNLELKTGGRTDDSIRNRARNLLIIAEIALSLILLVCAGLLIQSFERLQSVNPGFGLQQTLAVRLSLPPSKYRDRSFG